MSVAQRAILPALASAFRWSLLASPAITDPSVLDGLIALPMKLTSA